MLFARYAAKLAICCPFALLCYLPLSGFLRLPLKKLAAFGALDGGSATDFRQSSRKSSRAGNSSALTES